MTILKGIKSSSIIDDTYNASPASVTAALDVLYNTESDQRIAILGSMNELGDYSPEAHRLVAEHCDPKKLDFVVTIGSDAREYTAPLVKKAGLSVTSFSNPKKAGEFVASKITGKTSVILAKGSQNGVFAEEALKPLLADPKDEQKLVRQSAYWMARKQPSLSLD
jgi:UDP-N-acetylmuramoyl-tripeptide--D-alanyl-D-alanine ligase